VEAEGTLVIGEDNPFSSAASLVRFDPDTGERTTLSGPRPLEPEVGSGPALGIPAALAREASGTLLVADRKERAILRVDPVTGDRAIVSGCTDVRNEVCEGSVVGGGPEVTFPEGIAVESAGTILVAQRGQLLRVDAVSGDRTIVASATTGSGPALGIPGALRVEASGAVLWADEDSVALFRIDPVTGDRTPLSDASTGSGPLFRSVSDAAIETSGTLVVVDAVQGLAFRVDPVTGDRAILSGGPIHAGPAIECPTALVVEASGHLVLSDRCAAAVIRVDPETGDRAVVSDASRGSGPLLEGPADLALEPSGDFVILDRGNLMRVDAVSGDRTTVSSETMGSGRPLRSPSVVAVESSGSLLVGQDGRNVCIAPRLGLCAVVGIALIRVDSDSGDRSLLSGGGFGGRRGRGKKLYPFLDLVVEPSGSIVAGLDGSQVPLRRIDPITGNRKRVTREGCCEFEARDPRGITVDPSGSLFLADRDLVLEIEPVRERVSLVSGLPTGNRLPRGSGPLLLFLRAIAREESGALIVADSHPALLGVAVILRVDPATGDRAYVSR